MGEEKNTRSSRRLAKKQKKKNGNKKEIWKKSLISLLVIFIVLSIISSVTLFAIIKDAPELDPEQLIFSQAAQLYDQNDEVFSQLQAAENRIKVNINEVPKLVEDAFIATEDVRFHDHFGIDIKRLFGAAVANIKGGYFAEGASTITQQVVKNAFLTFDKKLERKIQEQYLAIKLEQQYSKDQILEMYLNAIYFGGGAYGVKQASILYFSKEDLNELTIADAALLAGLPQRPEGYNPLRNPEAAENRRNIVISLMERHGKITSAEAAEARAVPIEEQLNPSVIQDSPFQSFIDQVLSEVEQMEGISPTDLYTAGLKIYTTIDIEAQAHVERVLQTDEIIKTYPDSPNFQAGLTVIDTKTGEIKAIGGGRNKTDAKRAFNYATDIKRQPGSTIKPILDYGPVIEHLMWSTGHIIVDEPHAYSNGVPLRNYNRSYRGPVTMREAMADSLNIPAIKALQAVGLSRAQAFAEEIGIPFHDGPMTESYGIGGFGSGISTLDLAGAYAAFGNEGIYYTPHTVRKIEFSNGHVIETSPKSRVAMNDYTAFMVTDIMKSVVTSGTGRSAAVPGLAIAGKTGTTNFHDDEIRKYNIPSGGVPDVWFGGYTTNYSIAVWTGYDRMAEGNYLIGGSRDLAKQIFREVMSEISKGKNTPDFKQPPSVVRVGIERGTGLLPSPFTPESSIMYEYFVRGTEPTQVSEEFEKLESPTDFMGTYNKDTDQIILSWSHPNPEDISFKLIQYVEGQEPNTLTITNDYQYIITNPEKGKTYRFELIAISDEDENLGSDPASVEIQVPKSEDMIEIPDPINDTPTDDPLEPPLHGDEPDFDLPIDIIPQPDDNNSQTQ